MHSIHFLFFHVSENQVEIKYCRLGDVEYVVCRDDSGIVRAFHNVCRHHASLLASGSGQKSCFVCPYHGWTYGFNGALLKATRISGMRNFNVNGRILALYQSK